MEAERYPGERRGLRLFLEELMRVLTRRDARESMLGHAIRRALDTGELPHLRHARQIFNRLPRPERQALSADLLGPTRAPGRPPSRPAGREPVLTVSFETPRERDTQRPVRLELRQEPAPPAAAVRVTIEAGTLPSVAADALRRIAAMLEADRRLLSGRHWRRHDPAAAGEDGDGQRGLL